MGVEDVISFPKTYTGSGAVSVSGNTISIASGYSTIQSISSTLDETEYTTSSTSYVDLVTASVSGLGATAVVVAVKVDFDAKNDNNAYISTLAVNIAQTDTDMALTETYVGGMQLDDTTTYTSFSNTFVPIQTYNEATKEKWTVYGYDNADGGPACSSGGSPSVGTGYNLKGDAIDVVIVGKVSNASGVAYVKNIQITVYYFVP